jgi:methylglutaconyl-CoA hydratase
MAGFRATWIGKTKMQFVQTAFDHGIFRITLDRSEKRNALTREFIEEIHAAVIQAKQNPDIRVLIIQAHGSVFCAGMDLGEMQQRANAPDSTQQWQIDSQVYCDLLTTVLTLPIPTIAAVQGPVLAGGVGLVLACDVMIASNSAFFSLPEPARGITAAMVTPLLVFRIGAGPANYMLLSQERIQADKALTMGFCHDVTTPENLPERIDQLCESILSGSQSALSITKNHVLQIAGKSLVEQIKYSIEVSATARQTRDAREGLDAFLEKRTPAWKIQLPKK